MTRVLLLFMLCAFGTHTASAAKSPRKAGRLANKSSDRTGRLVVRQAAPKRKKKPAQAKRRPRQAKQEKAGKNDEGLFQIRSRVGNKRRNLSRNSQDGWRKHRKTLSPSDTQGSSREPDEFYLDELDSYLNKLRESVERRPRQKSQYSVEDYLGVIPEGVLPERTSSQKAYLESLKELDFSNETQIGEGSYSRVGIAKKPDGSEHVTRDGKKLVIKKTALVLNTKYRKHNDTNSTTPMHGHVLTGGSIRMAKAIYASIPPGLKIIVPFYGFVSAYPVGAGRGEWTEIMVYGGDTLGKSMKEGNTPTPAAALELYQNCRDNLWNNFKAGVYHLDINPGNVTEEGIFLDPLIRPLETGKKIFVGDGHYALNDGNISESSIALGARDVFSLALVIAEWAGVIELEMGESNQPAGVLAKLEAAREGPMASKQKTDLIDLLTKDVRAIQEHVDGENSTFEYGFLKKPDNPNQPTDALAVAE